MPTTTRTTTTTKQSLEPVELRSRLKIGGKLSRCKKLIDWDLFHLKRPLVATKYTISAQMNWLDVCILKSEHNLL
jgi:hypothetical protein